MTGAVGFILQRTSPRNASNVVTSMRRRDRARSPVWEAPEIRAKFVGWSGRSCDRVNRSTPHFDRPCAWGARHPSPSWPWTLDWRQHSCKSHRLYRATSRSAVKSPGKPDLASFRARGTRHTSTCFWTREGVFCPRSVIWSCNLLDLKSIPAMAGDREEA